MNFWIYANEDGVGLFLDDSNIFFLKKKKWLCAGNMGRWDLKFTVHLLFGEGKKFKSFLFGTAVTCRRERAQGTHLWNSSSGERRFFPSQTVLVFEFFFLIPPKRNFLIFFSRANVVAPVAEFNSWIMQIECLHN